MNTTLPTQLSGLLRSFRGENLPRPRNSFDWPKGFAFYDLEIGCGVGKHPLAYANQNQDRCLIAVEHTKERFQKFFQNYERAPLKNLYPVHANAISFVYHFVKTESLDRIFLLYPNPYPKNKQANLRWHNQGFFEVLLEKLKKGGTLNVATNLKLYAAECEEQCLRRWKLDGLSKQLLRGREALELGFAPRTHFEAKYLERNETCFDFVFQKK